MSATQPAVRVFGFAGWSGSGKTTLIEQLIANLVARGRRVALVKHAHHDFDIDQPGKDSHRHRVAGASEVLVSSARRVALIHELRGAPEWSLGRLLERLEPCDLVLVEGFKAAAIPKLEVHRPAVGKPLLYPHDPHVVALATDEPQVFAGVKLPVYRLDDVDALATLAIAAAGQLAAGV
jgi:molybdopterin-guanine dinucleotide biosynthesis adapter protein